MKTPASLLLLLMSALLVAGGNQNPDFSRQAWMEDYHALKKHIETGYANLEWMIRARRIDLIALDSKTRQAISQANSEREAKHALESFLAAFGDGHLSLRERVSSSPANPYPGRHTSGAEACQSLGFTPLEYDFSLPLTKAHGFQIISASKDAFTLGILSLGDGRDYGVLRIPFFFPAALALGCEREWEAFHRTLTGDCDEECRDIFSRLMANRLLAQLTAQLREMATRKLDGLIVDIGGNGGGTQWVEPVARTLAAKPLRAPRLRFIRHHHWVRALQSRLELLESDLQQRDLTRAQSGLLIRAKKQMRRLLAEARSPCDKSRIWERAEKRKPCSMLNATPIFTTGIESYAAPGSLARLRAKSVLFSPSLYEYQESAIRLPLIVLVDRHTASAAEYFAAMLQDNQAATIIGEKTYGSGCGYTDGGLKIALPNSRLQVWMPDCARYRLNGSNEVEGITPDLTIWSREDDETARLEKLLRALRQLKPRSRGKGTISGRQKFQPRNLYPTR